MAKHRIIRVDYSGASYLPPYKVMDAIHRSVSKVNSYPYEGYAEICKAIASYCGVREENILVTNSGGGDNRLAECISRIAFDQSDYINNGSIAHHYRIFRCPGIACHTN